VESLGEWEKAGVFPAFLPGELETKKRGEFVTPPRLKLGLNGQLKE
jgi:hypothetical protein